MSKHCSSCGAETIPGARFCRKCGAPLRNASGGLADGDVSPHSATVRLDDEGRTTDGLSANDPRRTSADTRRVPQVELERLLQQRASDTTTNAAPEATVSSPLTNTGHATPPSNTGDVTRPTEYDRDIGLKTRTSFSVDSDEDLTVVSQPRGSRPFDENTGARRVEPTPDTGAPPPPTRQVAVTHAPPVSPSTAALTRRRVWPYVAVAAFLLLLFVGAAAFVAIRFIRNARLANLATPTPTPVAEVSSVVEQKVAEADALLASGQKDAALAKLREANELDPGNWKAHRRLGELLWEGGQRREAIDEYRIAAANSPEDFTLWRSLGAAQLMEEMPAEAVDSYRRLISLVGDDAADVNDLLSFADALRLSGQVDEARSVYQKVASSPMPEAAAIARQRIAELAQPTPTPSPNTNTNAEREGASPTPTPNATPTPRASTSPTPQPTASPGATTPPTDLPADSYQRGVQLWSSNRGEALSAFRAAARAGNPDAHYYLGLSYVEGRDLSTLKRAELLAALQHFQNAQRGQHAARARQYAQQLESEFDRIRRPSP